MTYFKLFAAFFLLCICSVDINAQSTKVPAYDWSTFNLVDLDTIDVQQDLEKSSAIILYNYHGEYLTSDNRPYSVMYKAIQINNDQGVADFELDRLMISTFDSATSFGIRITSKNGEVREISGKGLEFEHAFKTKPKSDLRFTGYNNFDFTSELYYPKPLVKAGDLVEVYCKIKPYSNRLSGSLSVNEVLPVNEGMIKVRSPKDGIWTYALQPIYMKAEEVWSTNDFSDQSFRYDNVQVSTNMDKAIPTMCFPHVVYAIVKVSPYLYAERLNTIGWPNLIQVVSKNLDPFKTMKKDWAFFYDITDSIALANKEKTELEIFEETEKYIASNISLSKLKGDENHYSPGYYFKNKKINKSSVLLTYAAVLHRLKIPYYIGVGRRKHDGPIPFESYLFLDQYFLAIPNGESYLIYFEPTEDNYHSQNEIPIEMLGMEAVLFEPYGKVEEILKITLPQNTSNLNKRVTKLDIRLNKDGIALQGSQKMNYSQSTQNRFDLITDYKMSKWKSLSEQLSSLEWVALDSVTILPGNHYEKFEIVYEYNLVKSKLQLYDLLPPTIFSEISDEKRLYNYYGDFAKKETAVIMLHLPEGATIDGLDEYPKSYSNDAGKVTVMASGFGQMVNFQILVEQKEYNFSPEGYDQLREFVTKAKSYLTTPLNVSY